jgi:hypothetical protein
MITFWSVLSIFCGLIAALFAVTAIYDLLHYTLPWRLILNGLATLGWACLARLSWTKFQHRKSN